MIRVSKKRVAAALLLLAPLLVAAGAVVAYVQRARQAPEDRRRVSALQAFDLETFKKTFDAGSDGVRVLAMLSPT